MAKQMYPTPMLDALETGPWPSFVTGLKPVPYHPLTPPTSGHR